MNKWYVIKISEENKKKYGETNNFVICEYYDDLDEFISFYEDTIILITTSKEIAENTKRKLDEQIQKQSN